MKSVILFLIVATCLNAQAARSAKETQNRICQKLYAQAEASCEKDMIQECKENGGGEACDEPDGDFAVGVQICATESEWPFLIEKYNEKKNANLECDSESLD